MSLATIPTVPRVRPIVQIGVGDVFEAEGVGLWQPTPGPGTVETRWQDATADGSDDAATSTWVGDEPMWLDVTCHVQEISTFVGRERAIDTWEVGTASIICENGSGWADFPPTVEPEHPLLSVRPGRQIRVGVIVDDSQVVLLFGGYLDRTDPGYDAEIGETVTLECIDAKGEAGRVFVGEVTVGVGLGESASTRVARILNAGSWPGYRRDIASTALALRGTTLGEPTVDLLDRVADSSGGSVFGDVAGRVVYRARDWQAFSPTADIDGAIGNSGAAGEACPVSWEMSWAREDISTRVLLARPNEAPTERTNTTARRLYGVETYERSDLETDLDVELGQIADRILEVRSPAYMPRVAAVTLDAATGDEAVDVMCLASPYAPARFACRHRSGDRDVIDSRTMMVVGAEHVISPEGWTARIALDDAAPFMATDITRWQPDTGGPLPRAAWESSTSPSEPYAVWQPNI